MDETLGLPKRRRSSILNRQPPCDQLISTSATDGDKNEHVIKFPRFDNQAEDDKLLKGHINTLEAEQTCWHSLLKERKALKESAKSIATPELSWDTAHTFLTKEDIAFVRNEPNFEKIADNFDALAKRVFLSRVEYERVNHRAYRATQLAQSRLKRIKANIAEYSEGTVDIALPTF